MSAPETLYFYRSGGALFPLNDEDRAWLNRKVNGELVAFDRPKVKHQDPKTHAKFFLMTRIAFQNQPDPDICAGRDLPYFETETQFRYAWTVECGHVDVWMDVKGDTHVKPRSLAYNETTEDELIELSKRVSAAWRRKYGPDWTDGIIDEVARLAGGGNW